jgi:large subunit ribosomal protein L5
MQELEYFNKKTFKYDLINKFLYKNTKKLPKIQKIILNFSCQNTKLKNLSSSLLALELITNKKGLVTTSKKSNILLKIRKGNPVGCKVIFSKNNYYKFFTRFLNEILPKQENSFNFSKNNFNKNTYYYRVNNTFNFLELEKNYYLFNELNYLDINIIINSNSKKDIKFLLNSFKINN